MPDAPHFTGLDMSMTMAGQNYRYEPPIPGTVSRLVRLDHTRLHVQITALLRQSTPTTT